MDAPRSPAPRSDGRADDALRPVTITRHWLDHAAGSVLVEFGRTRVLCAASATEGVPRWRKGSGLGWVTAEYAMLPASTNTRSDRESVRGRIGGRTHEISRLIGRSLRAVIDYKALGENTIVLDCDVLQADGGTRTAAITGAYVALADAVTHLRTQGALAGEPLTGSVAAVSVGIIDGVPRLDLHYDDDVRAETDMNVVMTGDGRFVEVQGTAEGAPFDRAELDALLDLAARGLRRADPAAAGRPWRATVVSTGSTDGARVFLASRNAKKLGEMRRILAEHLPERRGARPRRRRGVRRAGRGPAHVRGQRAAQGPRRPGRDRAADGRRRQRPVRRRAQRDAGRALGPLVGAARSPTSATTRCCSTSSHDVPDERRGAHFTCAVAFCAPGCEPSWSSRAGWTAGSSARPRGSGGFGYDVVFEAVESPAAPPPSSTPPTRTRSPTAAGPCARSPRRSPPSSDSRRPRSPGEHGALSAKR